ncbi:MAG: hypothetical protein JW946_01215 [Candidatus Omnitrophica bacterium]|nr:hypothetical protein [Candidatus Omnitrophota bacterium]
MKKTAGAFAFAFIIFSISGCQTLKSYPPPSQLSDFDESVKLLESDMIAKRLKESIQPEKSQNKISAPTDSAWSSIRGRKLSISRPLALADLVDIALSNNPNTKWSWYNIQLAKAVEKQAESSLYPQAQVEAEKIVALAKKDIELEVVKAKAGLRADMTDMVLAATQRLLEEKITGEKDKKFVSDFISSMNNQK